MTNHYTNRLLIACQVEVALVTVSRMGKKARGRSQEENPLSPPGISGSQQISQSNAAGACAEGGDEIADIDDRLSAFVVRMVR